MPSTTMPLPMNVDNLYAKRPSFFPNPVPPMEDRKDVTTGEQVKVLIGIREDEQLTRGEWVIIESRTEQADMIRFTGRSLHTNSPLGKTFGPENIYRCEPRIFTLWGADGIPLAMRGQASNDTGLHPPLDGLNQPLAGCPEIILRFRASGRLASQFTYERLAAQHSFWPAFFDLS